MNESHNHANFESSIMDLVLETQIKLGYSRGAVRLYYKLGPLCRRLVCAPEELESAFAEFSAYTAPRLGDVRLTMEGDGRASIVIPAMGTEYVHEHMNEGGFLREFIAATMHCPGGIDDILAVFHRYSSDVACAPVESDEFDYLIYFPGGDPDAYRYCVQLHDGHATYHRFTKEDYDDFGF